MLILFDRFCICVHISQCACVTITDTIKSVGRMKKEKLPFEIQSSLCHQSSKGCGQAGGMARGVVNE